MLKAITIITILLAVSAAANAQLITADQLAIHSTGKAYQDNGWILDSNGYVGAYIKVDTPCKIVVEIKAIGVSKGATPQQAATILSDTMRLMFGHPSGQTFLMFGFYRGATWDRAAEGTLYNEDWSLSEPGRAYHKLLSKWSTDITLPVDLQRMIEFTGYYGDYLITIGEHAYPLTIVKGKTNYTITP